jgi:hypothetical protein
MNELKEILAAYEQASNDLRDSLNGLHTHRGTCLITRSEPAVNFPFYQECQRRAAAQRVVLDRLLTWLEQHHDWE